MRQRVASALLASLALASVGVAAQTVPEASPPSPPDPFVRVVGEHFVIDGAPFRALGANVAVLHGEAHRAALESTLDAVQADGLGLIRVWALGERDSTAPSWARSYAFRLGEEGWVEDSFVHLDRVLAAARARGLRVIVVLANRWSDYGGIPAYLRWAGDPFDASAPDGVARAELGTFFRSERAQALYRAHLERVVGRTNSLTGVAYRDDPTIFAWELVNEISAERRDAPALAAFVAQTARHVHALDPSHLVSAGLIGYETAADRRTWREVMALPEIDFADAHAYPTEHERVRSLHELDLFVDDHAMLAHAVLQRPLVMGEVGFGAARRAFGRTRAALFDHFLGRAQADGVDAALAWIYAPSTDRTGAHTILADHPDRDSRAVRDVLRARAAAMASIASPAWPSVDAPLWDPTRIVAGTRRVHWPRAGRVVIDPRAFAEARFETVGSYDGGAVAHVYGGGHGRVSYRFRAPRTLGRTMTITMRASSELPGRGVGAQPSDGSRVVVSIDGHPIGTIDVPPDDGIGRRVALELDLDAELVAILGAPGPRTLELEVPDGDDAHGLCLYMEETGHEPLPPELAAELPATIEIVFRP